MHNILNMEVLPILIFALISITGCKKYDFGETPDWHYLIVDDTYAPSWEGKTWVHYTCDYETQNDLYVEPIKYCDWVSDFDVRYEKMYVSLDSNKTGNDRSCLFVAYSEKTGQKDTFKIEQAKVHVPSGASSSGGSSSVFSGQCAARTKKGRRCKRRASKGSIYCWQHGG